MGIGATTLREVWTDVEEEEENPLTAAEEMELIDWPTDAEVTPSDCVLTALRPKPPIRGRNCDGASWLVEAAGARPTGCLIAAAE